ncbi:MAG: leucyl/phenylalanyl-tRNA--protein transferase, partial [Marinirhabdus sp.]
MHYLQPDGAFPPVSSAAKDGLLAIGGNLTTARLLTAYKNGIFPWYTAGQPVLWWSPERRMVLFPKKLKVSKSLRKTIRSGKFTLRCNTNFAAVIANCAAVPRAGQSG